MDKKKKIILIGVNIAFFIMLILSITIPQARKTVKYAEKDISAYSGRKKIPRIGTVTNQRDIEVRFSLYGETLYGVGLFFYGKGDDTQGEIVCTLKYGDVELEQKTFPAKEVFALMNSSSLNEKEIVFESRPDFQGEYTLMLTGRNLNPQTEISLYGSKNTTHSISCANDTENVDCDVLGSVEVLKWQHPYIWSMSLLLAMSLLCSCICYIGSKENESEAERQAE